MNESFNILRLCCLIQDRDSQDLKRTILSVIFEIFYENNNNEISSDILLSKTNEKFNTAVEKDFFDNLLAKSDSFVVSSTKFSLLIKLTQGKFDEIERNISEYSIEPHIEKFLLQFSYPILKKSTIVDILFQSIYENIYNFRPEKIETIIPQNISVNLNQDDLNIFNHFLEFDEPSKNRCLYNQFAKAIEFAILTSGKGVSTFSENIYKEKVYLLDTNVIFRLIGVGGEERRMTIHQLVENCVKQGIKFEYSYHTLIELNNKLEQCVHHMRRAESTRKIDIIQDILDKNPHFFNDDFVVQYSRLRLSGTISGPEQYELEMKAKFRQVCQELNICQAATSVKIGDSEVKTLAEFLIKRRKEIVEFYKYSNNQAKVDSYNVIYVRKKRESNNFNYADVKSFYLTTDRGLNRILSINSDKLIPETILPSQLFVIHNPLSQNQLLEPDYLTFFRFLKKRTSEFKLRGKDVLNYINQARTYTSDREKVVSIIEAYSDQRYRHSKNDGIDGHYIFSFTEFSRTYFDKKHEEMQEMRSSYEIIMENAQHELDSAIKNSNLLAKIIDVSMIFLLVPAISLLLKEYSNLSWYYIFFFLVIAEIMKFIASTRTIFLKKIWTKLFIYIIRRTSYFKISNDKNFIQRGIIIIENQPDNIWKYTME